MIKRINYDFNNNNNDKVYVITNHQKHLKIINKLLNKNYIIIYNGDVLNENPDTWVLVSSWKYTNKEYYKIVKDIFPHANVVHNMCELEIVSGTWFK